MEFNHEQIAKICHDANRSYCSTIGDNSQPSWEDAPQWQKSSALKGVEFHLQILQSGSEPSPSASHDSWLEFKKLDGWKYGEVKNPETKEHPCFAPYESLPLDQRMKDYIFGAIVKSFYAAQNTTTIVR